VTACRSLRSSYTIANKVLTHFFVKITGDGEQAIKDQMDDIKTLGKASVVEVNPSSMPASVGLVVIDDQTIF
jgi:valyl-tRNA synthetase